MREGKDVTLRSPICRKQTNDFRERNPNPIMCSHLVLNDFWHHRKEPSKSKHRPLIHKSADRPNYEWEDFATATLSPAIKKYLGYVATEILVN